MQSGPRPRRLLARSLAAASLLLLIAPGPSMGTAPPNAALAVEMPLDAYGLRPAPHAPGHALPEPTYESEFQLMDRAIVGRAPPGVILLARNKAAALNLQPGSTVCYMVQRSAMFGGDQADPKAPPSSLYLSANTCLQPTHAPSDGRTLSPPQLMMSVSNSSETACQNQASGPRENEGRVFAEGAVTYGLNITGDVFVGITAPNVSADFQGVYNFELAASPDDYLHRYDGRERAELLWMDSDSTSAILVTRNLTENKGEAGRIMGQALPYELYVSNADAPASAGLRRSVCGLRNTAQIWASQSSNSQPNSPVKTDMTLRGPGGFPKQQFHFVALNASSNYTAILVKKLSPSSDGALSKRQQADADPGSVVFRATDFQTVTGSSCKIVTDLEFCDEIQYAVPGNDRRFNSTALAKTYDDYAMKMYANFEKAMMQIPCEAASTSRYSLARNCDDCRAAYKRWLCTVVMPRCEDFGSSNRFALERNAGQAFPNGTQLGEEQRAPLEQRPYSMASRNPLVDLEIQPGPYKEILPCEDLCYGVVQSCPAKMGFRCPRPKLASFGASYGRRDRNGSTVACNFPGEARTPMSAAGAPLPDLARVGAASLAAAAALMMVLG